MVRTTIIPNDTTVNISFSVPENYIGKEMEIIAFTKREGLDTQEQPIKKASFDAISIQTKSFKFDRDEANER